MAGGGGLGFGAQHSQCVENWFLNIPGLKLCVPSTPADAYTLLRAAIRDDDPVLVFEHKALYGVSGELSNGGARPIGKAEIVRAGSDVTVVATQLMRYRVEQAAERFDQEGISVELIDLRTIAPLDAETVVESVGRTGRLVCVQEAPGPGSWGESVISLVARDAFELLDSQPVLVASEQTPLAYAQSLEEATIPGTDRITQSIRDATVS